MSEEERAIRERLAALEQEVKAEASAQRARKEAALAKVRAQRAASAAPAKPQPAAGPPRDSLDDELDKLAAAAAKRAAQPKAARSRAERPKVELDVGNALELARRAQGMRQELARPAKKGDKSWLVSAGLSTALGPVGWLYAGSWREAAPAAAAWVALTYVLSFLPTLLMLPLLMVALPVSGLVGVMYALSHNRAGSRQRLLGDDKATGRKKLQMPHEPEEDG